MSLYQEACKYIPGVVNSPVRAFRSVGGEPIFFKKASGSHLIAADGRSFIDYVGSWGPMILGHAHPKVIAAVQAVAADGLSFGAPTELETALARRVIELMPSIELVRFVSSGTEATMSAIRLARGFTTCCRRWSCRCVTLGSVNRKVVPTPSRLSSCADPPCWKL